MTLLHYEIDICFGTDTDPVDPIWHFNRTVSLNGYIKSRILNGFDRGSSNCSNGSPPVHTTKGSEVDSCGQSDRQRVANSEAVYFPPFTPSVPQKSVSQNLQIAVLRSFSSPDQRLHPENLQNTAGRPVWTPSPCIV